MQQVNLYLDELKPKNELLSAERSGGLVIILTLILSVFTLTETAGYSKKETQVVALETELDALKDQATVAEKKPKGNAKFKLENQIAGVRIAVKNRQGIETIFSGKDRTNKTGFSQFFFDLGNATPAGVSVANFSFEQSGFLASIHGVGKEARSIAEFVNRLQAKKAYENTRFGSLGIEKWGGVNKFHIGPKPDPAMDRVARE